MIPIVENSKLYGSRTAIIDATGTYSYAQLLQESSRLASEIIHFLNTEGLSSEPLPLLFLVPSSYEYVAIQWAIWLSGNIAVPVHPSHSIAEINYLATDTGSKLFIVADHLLSKIEKEYLEPSTILSVSTLKASTYATALPSVSMDKNRDALMIYTSGTTGKPKGVVMTHQQIDAQIRSLTEAWAWSDQDRILNVLPMHHVHGVINITCCALYNGAILEMSPNFDAVEVAKALSSGRFSLFMAVPTIYHKLIQHFETLSQAAQKEWQKGMAQMRLMVSGSAALPLTVLHHWQRISGHILLERYGMTEIGMALSNPLNGTRTPGYVGQPLPMVSVKIVDQTGMEIEAAFEPGELYVRGATVFSRYWQKEKETKKSFAQGWFKTGDIVERDAMGNYKILGRSSSDIIKSGGYKISALEIENVLLEHSAIRECAVIALPDEEWGEIIAAVLVTNAKVDGIILKQWLAQKLAPYKIPRIWKTVEELPRNTMGKLLKKELHHLFKN